MARRTAVVLFVVALVANICVAIPPATAADTPPLSAVILGEVPISPGSPSQLYLDPEDGWTWTTSVDQNNFWVDASRAGEDWAFALNPIAARPTVGQIADVDIYHDGGGISLEGPDAVVRDYAAAADGTVQRLDVILVINRWQPDGQIVGELKYGEPASAAVQAQPSVLWIPPTGPQSATDTYPVRLTSQDSTRVTQLAVRGPNADQFEVDSSDCGAAPVTSTAPCTAQVRYVPTSDHAAATLLAYGSDGSVVAKVPLHADRLPGVSVWGGNTWISGGYRHVRGGATVDFATTTSAGGTVAETVAAIGSVKITLTERGGIRPGYYNLASPDCPLEVGAVLDYYGFPIQQGWVRIIRADLGRTASPFYADPELVLTYEFLTPLDSNGASRGPLFGELSANTDDPQPIPGTYVPGHVNGLRARRSAADTIISWSRSGDVAVHDYIVRMRSWVHSSVGLTEGREIHHGPTLHTTIPTPSAPVTITVYAADDDYLVSRGVTLVIRP